MVKEPNSARGTISPRYIKKEDVIDLLEFIHIINFIIEKTFVFEKASQRQKNYLIDMGFKNLKEILVDMEKVELKVVLASNIQKDLTATIEWLRFDYAKTLYMQFMELAKRMMQKYCNQIEGLSLPTYIKLCKDLEVVPKIVSIPHAYILFTKLLPVHASSKIKEGVDDVLGASLYYCKVLTIDPHLFVYALISIALSVDY